MDCIVHGVPNSRTHERRSLSIQLWLGHRLVSETAVGMSAAAGGIRCLTEAGGSALRMASLHDFWSEASLLWHLAESLNLTKWS